MLSSRVNDRINHNLGGYFYDRQRQIPEERKKLIKELLSHYKPESVADVQDILKDLLGDTLQGMLEEEMDQSLAAPNMTTKIRRQTTAAMAIAKRQ